MRQNLLFSLLLLVAVVGCKAQAGDKCSRDGVCGDDPNRVLLCVSKKYVAGSCRGPNGCTKSPVFQCDFRGNVSGDPCFDNASEPTPAMYCTEDKKARVRCVGGKVERDECDGPRGCFSRPNTETLGCDRSLRAGAACSVDGDWCSTDSKDWLTCKSGKLVVAAKCRGPAACKPFDESIACDVSIAEIDDPCVGIASACSLDGSKVLSCQGGAMKVSATCATGKPCSTSKDGATCRL